MVSISLVDILLRLAVESAEGRPIRELHGHLNLRQNQVAYRTKLEHYLPREGKRLATVGELYIPHSSSGTKLEQWRTMDRDKYQQGIDFEVAQDIIGFEIARLPLHDPDRSEAVVEAAQRLVDVRDLLHPDEPSAVQIALMLLRHIRYLREGI